MRFDREFTPLPPNIQANIISAYKQGKSFLTISLEFGVTIPRLRRCLVMARVEIRAPGGQHTKNLLAPGDWEANINARNFIEETLQSNPHIEVTDAGVGPCSADLGITIDGAPFSIVIKPRLMKEPPK